MGLLCLIFDHSPDKSCHCSRCGAEAHDTFWYVYSEESVGDSDVSSLIEKGRYQCKNCRFSYGDNIYVTHFDH